MSWEMVLLGDVIETLKGYAFKSGHYVESGVPIVRASNFTMDSISNDDLKFYTEDEATQFRKYELSTDDVLIQTVGSWESNPASVVGKVVRVPQMLDGALLNQNIVKVFPADKDQLDLQYLFYRLKCHDFKRHNIGNAVGAANQASITLDTIRAFAFLLPNIVEQRRIATILRGYDDLIENNQKQIKLLEEAAQRLYKEWFVDLRFPGHETTPITNGLPEGWKKDRVDAFFNMSIGKTPPRAEKQWFTNGGNGIPWISISDMGNSATYVFNTAEELTAEAISKHNVKVVPADTVLVSFKLTVGRVSITTTDMCTNEAIAHFLMSDSAMREYTYLYLKCFEYDSLGNTSAISKAVNSKIIKGMPFVMPDDVTIAQFHKIVKPILDAIKDKQNMNTKLSEARDRLLPKLMNGEIEV